MKILDLITDKTLGSPDSLSLSRSVALLTFIVLSLGFGINAIRYPISWEVYIAYPIGVIAAFAPQLFLRLIDSIKDVGGLLGRGRRHRDDGMV